MQIATAETWYETRTMDDGVTYIYEPFIKEFYRCNIWHVKGSQRDMLVDSGMGVVSLREQIPMVTEKKCLAVASHTHFDHIGLSPRVRRAAGASRRVRHYGGAEPGSDPGGALCRR